LKDHSPRTTFLELSRFIALNENRQGGSSKPGIVVGGRNNLARQNVVLSNLLPGRRQLQAHTDGLQRLSHVNEAIGSNDENVLPWWIIIT
jgi:hypothetical protein